MCWSIWQRILRYSSVLRVQRKDMKRSVELDTVRAVSCIFILIFHISGYTNGYNSHGFWGWANIGVQMFFFLSGVLAANSDDYSLRWIKRRFRKIYIPYEIYLFIIIPIILVFNVAKVNWLQLILAFSGTMGFIWKLRIEPIGVLWFVSYILLCYALTPIFNRIYNRNSDKKRGGWVVAYIGIIVVMQAITIPLALSVQFKSAWIACYLLGFFIQKRKLLFPNGQNSHEFSVTRTLIYFAAIIGVAYRICAYKFDFYGLGGLLEAVNDLVIQYIQCIQGAAATCLIVSASSHFHFRDGYWLSFVNCICKYSYEIYLVQGFFCDNVFTSHLTNSMTINFIIIVLMILVSSLGLKCVSDRLIHEPALR